MKNIFKKRINGSKSYYNVSYKGKNIEIDRLIKDKDKSITYSKLFWEIFNLLDKNKQNWNETIKHLDKYKNIEPKLIEIIIQKNLEKSEPEKRDWVMHRSISKFKTWNDLTDFIKEVDINLFNEIR